MKKIFLALIALVLLSQTVMAEDMKAVDLVKDPAYIAKTTAIDKLA